MQAAASTFLLALDSHKWVQLPSAPRGRKQPAAETPASRSQAEGAPPYSLMDHAPLALLANGLLAALNELRHCAPLSLRGPVASVTQVLLRSLREVCCMNSCTYLEIMYILPFLQHWTVSLARLAGTSSKLVLQVCMVSACKLHAMLVLLHSLGLHQACWNVHD